MTTSWGIPTSTARRYVQCMQRPYKVTRHTFCAKIVSEWTFSGLGQPSGEHEARTTPTCERASLVAVTGSAGASSTGFRRLGFRRLLRGSLRLCSSKTWLWLLSGLVLPLRRPLLPERVLRLFLGPGGLFGAGDLADSASAVGAAGDDWRFHWRSTIHRRPRFGARRLRFALGRFSRCRQLLGLHG